MTRDQDVSVRTLASELARMGRLVEDEEHEEVARRFAEHLVHAVPGCDLALLAVDRGGEVDVAATTGHPPLDLAADQGDPVREALRYREPRRLGDTTQDHRWPLFAARLAVHGHRSCLVLPLPTLHSPTAAAVLMSREPHRFNDHSYDIILLIALHAGVALDNVEVLHHSKQMVRHLTTALDTRHTIGLAQGLLMRHFAHDTEQSFTLLRRASQHTNRKLRDIAHDLVTAHECGDFDEVLARHRIPGPDGVPM
ncbi:GAF and ANTAR domain-containing protein [Saccharothrix texasensis]|uniref:AmiR/NasT family two-component response regulator n=1 Tax=Saccharothrix texasensis TaxID=103734 RepID=A0A3N1GYE8_9PSEU|nr:GAF and ANTAR domain-containing protein [Saccharothrix texasensis]ROP35052.1 AmiR/NasT family two-component response regulator [Saccharothrix texasensis]